MLIGVGMGVAAQFNSSSILYGLGKHRSYARSLVVEAGISIPLMLFAIPRYGILGAAVVSSVLMALNRGLLTPYLFCREIHYRWLTYMLSIYVRPVLTALPVTALLLILKRSSLKGDHWPQLIAAALIAGVAYLPAAFFTCVQPEHRRLMRRHLVENKLIRRLSGRA
jgi:O-antigen/teichoic acid export membrane protein